MTNRLPKTSPMKTSSKSKSGLKLKTKLKSKAKRKQISGSISGDRNGNDDNEDIDGNDGGDDGTDDNGLRSELSEMIADFRRQTSSGGKRKASKHSDNKSDPKTKTIDAKNSLPSVSNVEKIVPIDVNTGGDVDGGDDNRAVNLKLMVKRETKWYEMRVFDESVVTSSGADGSGHRYDHQKGQELRREAEQLMTADVEAYRELQMSGKGHKSDDWQWIRQVLVSGTLADKLSAHTVLLQDSPVHNLRSVEQMLSMVTAKAKRECILAIDTLRDLFIGDLLMPEKKLRTFTELIQSFDDQKRGKRDRKSRCRQLIVALFEDRLKQLYRQFLDAVVAVSHDALDTLKHKSLVTIYDLLVNNPEQEQYLLSQLCNKLGDPIPKIAAQSTHLLNQLINRHHPFMKPVVVDEVERVLYRPNIAARAQYYSLCFLSEVIFAANDQVLANRLIALYFGFFKACCKKGDLDNKMMSVLLTGVSRAFPYSRLDSSVMEDHLQTFYKLIHFVNENTAIQALCLIFNILDVQNTGTLTDRFYLVLYRHLQDVQLDRCSRRAMLLNLVFRAMKRDPIVRRIKAFIKRLLQVAVTQSSSLATAILILISEVIQDKPGLALNREVMADTNHSVAAPAVGDTNKIDANESDDDEHYEDVPLSDDELSQDVDNKTKAPVSDGDGKKPVVSWLHNKNINAMKPKSTHYDPNARNPLFAAADQTSAWELLLMIGHYHPSTQLFAQKVVANEKIDYSGDPLADFSVKHFLDRFVFRNPKKLDKKHQKSSIETRVFGRNLVPTSADKDDSKGHVMNAKDYVTQPVSRVPVDEMFIYNYLKQKQSMVSQAAGDDSDAESVTSVEFESLLDRLEPMSRRERALDFHSDLNTKSKRKSNDKKTSDEDNSDDGSDDESSDGDDGSDIGDDDDMDFDADDPDFNDAFDGLDDDLEEAFGDEEDGEDDGQRKGKVAKPKGRNKRGFDRMTNAMFASADEFAELLDNNEASDSDDQPSDGEGKASGSAGRKRKASKTDRKADFRVKRKLGRNHSKNKKKQKVNPKDLL